MRSSSSFRSPAPLPRLVIVPTGAAAGKVFALGKQALLKLVGEQGDAIHPGVVAEEGAGEANLAAAGPEQHVAGEVRLVLVGDSEIGDEGR